MMKKNFKRVMSMVMVFCMATLMTVGAINDVLIQVRDDNEHTELKNL